MTNNVQVSLAEALDCEDIPVTGAFKPSRVIDLRCTETGSPRPIEEAVLRRLKNHFVEYDQMPMVMDEVGPCQDVHLCECIREKEGHTLVLTHDIAQVATLLSLFDISFESSVFYVVETGKGKVVKPMSMKPANPIEIPDSVALTA